MHVEANRAVARYVAEAVWNRGDLSVIDEVFAPGCVNHDAGAHNVRDLPALRRWIEQRRAAFPDSHFRVEEIIAEGDRVVLRWSWEGTQTGYLGTMPPSGNAARLEGVTVERFQGGRIIELWWYYDTATLLHQIGVLLHASEVGG